MKPVEPGRQHQWLRKLLGEWTFSMGDAHHGTEIVKPVGDLWIVGEGEGTMPGGGAATHRMTLGYDPDTEQFVGTWIGSMMTCMWIYRGSLDESETVLTLDTEGPDMEGQGKTAQYRDVIEFKSDDYRTLTSYVLRDCGEWRQFMTADYRRK